MRFLTVLALLAALAGCASVTKGRERCGDLIDAAWNELNLAKAQGFSGTVSYSKAVALLTRAKTNQIVEDYPECVNTAERARFYIAESRAGR